MSSTTITVMRCDRCGHQAEVRQPIDGDGWGKLVAQSTTLERSRGIGARSQPDDLCPGCVDALFAWWATPGDVAQPAPPPAAFERPRPMFTIEDRSGIALILREALVAQAKETGCAYHAAPTTALHPEVPPIALVGIPDRAIDFARRIIVQLEAAQRSDVS